MTAYRHTVRSGLLNPNPATVTPCSLLTSYLNLFPHVLSRIRLEPRLAPCVYVQAEYNTDGHQLQVIVYPFQTVFTI